MTRATVRLLPVDPSPPRSPLPSRAHYAWLLSLWSEWDAFVVAHVTQPAPHIPGAIGAPLCSMAEREEAAHLAWARGPRPPLPRRQAATSRPAPQ
jgi:hypothetical protein